MNRNLINTLNLKEHKTIADSIPILNISEDGTIEVRPGYYSRTYRITDINFGIAKNDERGSITDKWARILKSVNPAYELQICVYKHSVNIDYLSDAVFLKEQGDGCDELRNDINRVIKANLLKGNNGIRKDIYLTLTIPAADMDTASREFVSAEQDIIGNVSLIPGCSASLLDARQRLNLIRSIYAGGEETDIAEFGQYNRDRVVTFSLDNYYRMGVTPNEIVQPASIEIRKDYFCLGAKYGRALTLSKLSSYIDDDFIRDFTSLPYSMLFTIDLKQIETVKANELVKRQRTNASAAVIEAQMSASRNGYSADLIPDHLQDNFLEAKELLQDLQRRDQKLFETKMHVVIFADSKEDLENKTSAFVTKCRTKDVAFTVAKELQENALNSAMPFGLDCTPKHRSLTTETLQILVPFSSQEMMMAGGTVYGLNKITHNVITFDRMAGDSYNMLVLGFTGSGKSFFCKTEILNTYLSSGNEADVIIIDPQDEYGKICRSVNGQEIVIKSAGEHHINPLDISADYGVNPIAEKAEFIQSMMAEILNHNPSAIQRSAISIATNRVYEKWRKSQLDEDIPTLYEFHDCLVDYYEANGRLSDVLDLIKSIEFYTEGTSTIFQGRTNVDTGSSFISYNISDLGESIRPLAMLVILDSILNRMARNRKLGKPTYVYIDEIHLLFKKEQTAQWIRSLWKTARKYKCAPCGITQDCEDILASDAGRAVLTNTSFVVLLKQASINANVLATQLQLSQRQLSYVTDSRPGEGLLYIQNASKFTGGVIPFENRFPKNSKLYAICHTTESERKVE